MRELIILISILATLVLSGCSGCSKSGRMKRINTSEYIPRKVNDISSPNRNIIKMEKDGGVYKIPIQVNGTNMYFIFDTGASLISISNVEASFLYKQGKLTDEDIIGKANFTDANGDISEGTIILLREVRIGNRTLNNVEASVVNNSQAPLLFGQSALEKFGKISIDYNQGVLIFE